MIDRYPHFISFKEQSSPSFNENGDPVAAADEWSRLMPCRWEADGRSNIQVQKDGTLKTYAYVVYMRLADVRRDFTGTTVRLYDAAGEQVCECLVHHSSALQLSTILYIERCL